jgi:hypothetical protein
LILHIGNLLLVLQSLLLLAVFRKFVEAASRGTKDLRVCEVRGVTAILVGVVHSLLELALLIVVV